MQGREHAISSRDLGMTRPDLRRGRNKPVGWHVKKKGVVDDLRILLRSLINRLSTICNS